jgi:CO/xanthine dehydrogenase Mo-binding subunit
MIPTMVGKGIPTIDAREKATGLAKFCVDLKLPGMLYGKVKRSPLPFARILNVDKSRAEKVIGVKAVIAAEDVLQAPYGSFLRDQLPLAQTLVRFAGDEVAAVAAIDEEVAEEAVELIQVEYEELPPVLDPAQALLPDAPPIHPELEKVKNNIAYSLPYERGSLEQGLREADLILEERFLTQEAHQSYLEPQACIAQFDASGKLTYWASLQALFNSRKLIAQALNMTEDRIRLIQTYVGGGFGGKASAIQPLYPISALLARKAARPVKIVNTRKEEFIAGRPRLPEIIDLKMGFKKNGEIVAKDAKIFGDGGAYAGMSPAVLVVSATRAGSLYRIPNIRMDAKLVYTNKIPKGAFRGFGSPQMIFALESMIDDAAERLGIDPLDLRLKNATRAGDTTVHGWAINSCGLSDSIRQAGEKAGWKAKRRKDSGDRGIGMGCLIHVSSKRGMHPLYDGSSAMVLMNEEGNVKVISGEGDIGQGASTLFAQIVAEEIGVPLQDIQILPVDTDISPTCLGAFASRVTTMGGNAVKMAAENLRQELLKEASQLFEVSPESLEIGEGKVAIKGSSTRGIPLKEAAHRAVFRRGGGHLVGIGNYTVPDSVQNPDPTQYGNISVAYPFGTQVAEVKVDRKTGQVELLGIWAAHDLGRVMNSLTAAGQVEGGVAQGIGYALTESYFWENGTVLNSSFTDYRIPTALDIPPIDVTFIETLDPGGPYGAKGLAEPALIPTAAAIGNAIFHALGIRIRELPFTPERILRALKASQTPEPGSKVLKK